MGQPMDYENHETYYERIGLFVSFAKPMDRLRCAKAITNDLN